MAKMVHFCTDRLLPGDQMRFHSTVRRPGGARAIMPIGKLWMNGSTLRVRFLEGTAAHAVLAAAGLPGSDAIALRRSALAARRADPLQADPRGLAATVRAVRATPDEVRLVVDVEGVGEADAVGAPGWLPAPGARVVLRVDSARLAVLPSGPAAPTS